MKPARLAVLGIAILAGGAAALMMGGGDPAPVPQVVEAPPSMRTVEVLVAAVDLPMGQSLKAADLRWLAWPADSAPNAVIKRTEFPNGLEETTGSIARSNFFGGEPIRREKLIKADGSGFMSAILPAGMRAVAISIDTRGATSAGGFILPNDRVDIIRTFRDDESSRSGGVDVHMSETILANIRVLAIGQNVQERNGEKVVTGETATLELTPAQAELITLRALEKNGMMRLLAEPTLVAVSGESAKFLAGGEIPYPSGETIDTTTLRSTITISYRPVGVSLNFTPVVLSERRISLRISTEVSELDKETAISLTSVRVPGIKTRRTETTVEVPSGASLISAGMIQQSSRQVIDGFPGLKSLPILGALFRSREYERQETELMIMVTPYIAKPVEPDQVTRPDDGFVDSHDAQAVLALAEPRPLPA